MRILKKLKYNKAEINAIVLLIWLLIFSLICLKFFGIITISLWYYMILPILIIGVFLISLFILFFIFICIQHYIW
mgnify:CR=1 FL=1